MAQTFALPWYLYEPCPVAGAGWERIFVLAKETATGDPSPRGATRWDETVRNDLKMDYDYYSVLPSVWVAGRYSDDHHYGE